MSLQQNFEQESNSTLKLVVLCPHFEPDTAPTGVVMTTIVHELAKLGHEIHVVTALPWYRQHRVESAWAKTTWRTRTTLTTWGSVTRLNPFAGDDKKNLWRRALGFIGFSVISVVAGFKAGRVHSDHRRVDAVIAMSPPLTLGLSGWLIAKWRRAPLVFNIQDVFPDAAIETGAITNQMVIKVSRWLEKISYRSASIVTVLSDDLRDNVIEKLPVSQVSKVVVIPNFVDTEVIRPRDRMTKYRSDLGIDDRPVVMYAGNVGFSQSLNLMLDAAREFPDVAFVVNGSGAARASLEADAKELSNVVFGDYQPIERLSEVLATADIHAVLLKRGLGKVSVPSKTYSVMAAGRAVVAAIDPGTEVTRLIGGANCGLTVAPDDSVALIAALRMMLADLNEIRQMGERARQFVEQVASPASVAQQYVTAIHGVLNGRLNGTQQGQ
jgi:colanic acid biosynthesis glycosyl transferase WcaI